jgi:hypothetical protein
VPTSIIVQSSSTPSAGATPSSTSTTVGIPSSFPRVILPGAGVPEQPSNTTLIQIGFNYPLNYRFVVSSPVSVAQIFEFLPQGIAYGLTRNGGGESGDGVGIPVDQVVMQSLQPSDTSQQLGYITTLAFAYIPSDLPPQLERALHTPISAIYRNPNPSVNTLMGMINPSWPILARGPLGSVPGGGYNGPASTGAPGGDGTPLGGSASSSSSVKGTSIGIGVGVVAGAAVYGAAMFFVARRYKQRKQRHSRSSSIPAHDPSDALMGGALMSGGRETPIHHGRTTPSNGRDSRGSGRSGSARAQQISAPMMAENSLGWN